MSSSNPLLKAFTHKTLSDVVPEASNVITIPSTATALEALSILTKNHILSAPVIDPETKHSVSGVVDMLDFVTCISKYGFSQLKTDSVERIMDLSGKDPYVPVYLHSELDLCVRIMSRGIHRIMVLGNSDNKQNGTIYGMLSQTDVVRMLSDFVKEAESSPDAKNAEKYLMDTTLRDVNLHEKEVFTIQQDATVKEAFDMIAKNGLSALAVVNKDNKVVGNFSASDLRQLTHTSKWDDLNLNIVQFLETHAPNSLNPVCASVDSALLSILQQLVPQTADQRRLHRLWITNEADEPVSVVSLTDILRIIITAGASADESTFVPTVNYYTPKEVSLHSTPNDLWVSLLGRVYDLTSLVQKYKGSPLAEPLFEAAGNDISHWFDETGDVKTWIDPVTNTRAYYTPMGRFIHVPSAHMTVDENGAKEETPEKPWWKDSQYQIGQLATKTRMIRIVNTLTHQNHDMEVSSSETLNQILERYKDFNDHAGSYTWKRLGKNLNMNKTLAQNGIEEEDEELSMTDNYIPVIHIYFNDDLKYSVDD